MEWFFGILRLAGVLNAEISFFTQAIIIIYTTLYRINLLSVKQF